MSETTIPTPAAVEQKAPSAAKKPTQKPAAKKAVKKSAPVASANGKADGGLRKPQLRILKALARTQYGLTRSEIASKAEVDQASLVEYVGSADERVRLANDSKHFKSLVSLGHVKVSVEETDGRDVVKYTATAKGRAVAKKL